MPQLRNIALCSQLQEAHRSLAALLPRLPAPAAAPLLEPLERLHNAAVRVVAPLFKSIMAILEDKLAEMHAAPAYAVAAAKADGGAGGDAGGGITDTSPFVTELAQRLTQFRRVGTLLSALQFIALKKVCCKRLSAIRCTMTAATVLDLRVL